MGDVPLPTGLDELTPAWLTAALSDLHPDAVVEDARVVDVVHGTTTKIRLALDLNDVATAVGPPSDVCVKVNFESHAPTTLALFVYVNEARFYRHLRPHLPLVAPAAFYADDDAASGQGLVVMEDLVAAGATFGRNTEPLTADEAAGALDDLAQLHLRWWDDPQLEHLTWLRRSLGRTDSNMAPWGGWDGVWQTMHRPERAALAPPSVNSPERLAKAFDALVAREQAATAPVAVLHGDTHLGNSYRTAAGTLRWLDWQMVRKGRPMREVSYFLGCALDVETRRAAERDLIGHYLDRVASAGAEPPTFDDAWRQHRGWPIWGLICWAVTEDGWQPRDVKSRDGNRFAVRRAPHSTLAVHRTV